MKWGSFLISIFVLFGFTPTKAADIQDLKSLRQTAENYVESKLSTNSISRTEITAGKLDSRLRLTACSIPLVAYTPPGSHLRGNTTVGVRCDSDKPWSIYIAVKIAIYQQAIVSTNSMTRGQIIGDSDISLEEVDISRLRGHSFELKENLVGTKLKTSVKANQIIDSASVCLICKGDAVLITASSSVIDVSVAGTALNDGSRGDKIRVQNNASRRIIDAVVIDIGTVNAGH